jgi:hypothetical protein
MPSYDSTTAPGRLTLAQLRENLIDLTVAIADEDDPDRLAELYRLYHETREAALDRRELHEVRSQ